MAEQNLDHVVTDLRKSLVWLDLVLSTLDEGVVTLEKDMKIHFANDAMAAILHKERIFLLGAPIWEALPLVKDGKAVKKADYKRWTNKDSFSDIYTLSVEDKTLIVEVSIGYIPNIKQTVVVVRDITKQKNDEEALRQETAFVQLHQKIAVAANESKSFEEAMNTCIRLLCSYTGWAAGHVFLVEKDKELISTNIWYLKSPRKFLQFRRVTEANKIKIGEGLPGRVLKSGKSAWITDVNKDTNFIRAKEAAEAGSKAGVAFPVLVGEEIVAILEFFSTEAIEPNEHLLDVMAHIGTQLGRVVERSRIEEEKIKVAQEKAARAEAEMARRKAEESEERFRTLIEQSADAIQLVSPQGEILYTSESIKTVLGYTPEELHGQGVAPYMHPDDLAYFNQKLQELLDGPKKQVYLQYRVKHKDGSWAWVETTGVNHLNTPNINALVGTFRNITERKLLERQKDDFLGIASHELKTPVTSIKAYGQVLQSVFRQKGDTRAAEQLAKMDAQVDRLTDLISDLLDVTKIQTGKLLLKNEPFDFNTLVSEVVEEMQLTTQRHTLVKKLAKSQNVYADKNRIGQVIINLISNAIKYSPHSDKIIISTTSNKKSISLCVEDFGVGIPKEKLEHVFERFFRVNGPIEITYPGLGLGLFISSEIIKRVNGTIWVKSIEGKGSKFCFSIPIYASGKVIAGLQE